MTDQVLHAPAPVFVGELLREARTTHGLSIEVVSKVLCINKAHLINLEEDRGTLACNVYTIGFLKSYAQFLGLNATALIQKLKEQAAPTASSDDQTLAFPTPQPEKGMPSKRTVLLSLLVLIGGVVGYAGWKEFYRVSLPPQERILPSSPSVAEHTSTSVAPQPIFTSAVNLVATGEAWIEVKDGQGNILVRRLLSQGETLTFDNALGHTLRTGNAGGIRLVSGEKVLDFPGENGMIRDNISLEPARWHTPALPSHDPQ